MSEKAKINYIEKAKEIIDIEISGLQRTRERIGESFHKAVCLLLKCIQNGGKAVVTGIGKSLHIAQKVSATLASTGTPSVVLHPSQALHGDLGIINSKDVLIAISYSGESEELLNLIPHIKRLSLKIIAITGDENNSLAKTSDIIITTPIEKEACPFNMAPTTSTTTALAVGDAIAMVLLEAQGFCKEDYAKLHPGGAIGRSLLLRASDILRPPDRTPVVSANASIRDALIEMTRARAGSCAVIDDSRHVVGIFTDGDLRRHLSKRHISLEDKIETVMTRNPIVVYNDQLAVDVLSIFEKHDIDDLLVINREKQFVGLIDIQDLPKLKII